ncbi:MAG: hypothetical protein KAR81_07520 [Sulfurimonas sp.]|nr:hypothetical protein [Sulfurimonas sp.]
MNKNIEPTKKELFVFVFIFTAILSILAFYPLTKGDEPKTWLIVLSLAFIVLPFFPKLLISVYNVWVKFGSAISRINSYIILNFLFYFIITPMGIVIRLFGKDPLSKKINKNAKSYWSTHENNSSMKNQF